MVTRWARGMREHRSPSASKLDWPDHSRGVLCGGHPTDQPNTGWASDVLSNHQLAAPTIARRHGNVKSWVGDAVRCW